MARGIVASQAISDSVSFDFWRGMARYVVDSVVYDSAVAVIEDATASDRARSGAHHIAYDMLMRNRDPNMASWLGPAVDANGRCLPEWERNKSDGYTTDVSRNVIRPLTPRVSAFKLRALALKIAKQPSTSTWLRRELGVC